MFKFPYTNYQELNLNWIVKQVKTLLETTKHDVEVVEQYENRLILAEQAAATAEENSANAITRADAAASNAQTALTQTVVNTGDISNLQISDTVINTKIGDLSNLTTPHKDNLVNAINDAAGSGGGSGAVQSVNGQTGFVVLDAADVGALPDNYTPPVTSVNGQTGDVIISGGGAVDSVNGYTGTVVLSAADVGALPDNYTAPVTSVNSRTGAVTVSELPSVSAADNGKVLMVVNGAWRAENLAAARGLYF